MVYVKHFDILGIDTAQIPCIELQGAPNSATVGAVGLLGLDVTSGEVYVCTKVEGAINTWQRLKDGKDGTCVNTAIVNVNGELVLTLSDGTEINAGVVVGNKGDKGDKGDKGETGAKGDKGDKGDKGATGEDGVSITKVELTANSELVITLSNGTVVNLGSVKGNQGDKGEQYTLTDTDKQEIASIALDLMPWYEGETA